MASTTKIMTCILALENGNPEEFCRFSPKAASQPKVHLGVPAGTEFRLQELLYSLMLESHNDSAVAIAEHIGCLLYTSRGMSASSKLYGSKIFYPLRSCGSFSLWEGKHAGI